MAGEPQAPQDWHRRFGLLLIDLFTGSPFDVEVERDLSVQQQLLDVVIVRRGRGRFAGRLPDGLEGLRAHNLITFKSRHEALDAWAARELIAHFVAYRKFVSPSPSDLLPEEQFGLYAVTARFPQGLAGQVPWQPVGPGVYDCRWGTDTVRVVVAGELPRLPHNAPLHLFSASAELVGYGGRAYKPRSAQTSRLLLDLFEGLRVEGMAMPYTMEDFNREFFRKHLLRLTPAQWQEFFQTLPAEQRRQMIQTLPPEQQQKVLQALPPERRQQVLQALPPEERLAGLPPEERLAGLSEDQIRQYLDRLTGGQPGSARKPRRKK